MANNLVIRKRSDERKPHDPLIRLIYFVALIMRTLKQNRQIMKTGTRSHKKHEN